MKCPNCSVEIFPEDKFCGECGEKVDDFTENGSLNNMNTEPNDLHNSSDFDVSNNETAHSQKTTAGAAEISSLSDSKNVNSYINSGMEMFKESFKSPGRFIGSKDYFPPALTVTVVALLILLFSILTFIFARSSTASVTSFYGEEIIPGSALFQLFIYTSLLFVLFFGILLVLNLLVIRNSVPWQKTLNDYAVSSIVVISFYILGILLEMIRLYEIGAVFLAIGGLLFAFAPLYIFLRYAENNNTKFDSFYSLVLYIVLCAIGYYIVIRIIIAQIADSALGNLLNTF
ncbi:hypothetical protein [Salinicoccus sp. HZC-1]|uniref:hypothetical protein n=1 Tax=Salinicoccus sp. HZC-1 TaxID=3385497 RepID=UPI00398B4D86